MGRFINADVFASTGQGVLGNNMFVYCGNNPTSRIDASGELWGIVVGVVCGIIATINDIYQLARNDEKKVTATKTAEGKSVQVSNSIMIITPWVKMGYSIYLNYFSEYKDYFTGSSTGMVFEWVVHNVGFHGFSIIEKTKLVFNQDTTTVTKHKESCRNVDLGPTIYHDSGTGMRGKMSTVMKGAYNVLFPKCARFDAFMYYLN